MIYLDSGVCLEQQHICMYRHRKCLPLFAPPILRLCASLTALFFLAGSDLHNLRGSSLERSVSPANEDRVRIRSTIHLLNKGRIDTGPAAVLGA
jgi:hypothetical protein